MKASDYKTLNEFRDRAKKPAKPKQPEKPRPRQEKRMDSAAFVE